MAFVTNIDNVSNHIVKLLSILIIISCNADIKNVDCQQESNKKRRPVSHSKISKPKKLKKVKISALSFIQCNAKHVVFQKSC